MEMHQPGIGTKYDERDPSHVPDHSFCRGRATPVTSLDFSGDAAIPSAAGVRPMSYSRGRNHALFCSRLTMNDSNRILR